MKFQHATELKHCDYAAMLRFANGEERSKQFDLQLFFGM